jgi:hypothetical protein
VATTFWEEYVERNEAGSSYRTLSYDFIDLSEAVIALAAKELMVHDAVKVDLTT